MRVGLRKTLPQVKHDEVEYSRTWLRFATAEMESLMADGYWPIFLNVRRDTQSDEANTRFTIRLIWVTGQFHKDNCDVEALRQHMAKVFPGLDKFGGSEYRRLVLASKLNTPTPSAGKAVRRRDRQRHRRAQERNHPGLTKTPGHETRLCRWHRRLRAAGVSQSS